MSSGQLSLPSSNVTWDHSIWQTTVNQSIPAGQDQDQVMPYIFFSLFHEAGWLWNIFYNREEKTISSSMPTCSHHMIHQKVSWYYHDFFGHGTLIVLWYALKYSRVAWCCYSRFIQAVSPNAFVQWEGSHQHHSAIHSQSCWQSIVRFFQLWQYLDTPEKHEANLTSAIQNEISSYFWKQAKPSSKVHTSPS